MRATAKVSKATRANMSRARAHRLDGGGEEAVALCEEPLEGGGREVEARGEMAYLGFGVGFGYCARRRSGMTRGVHAVGMGVCGYAG